MIINELIFTQMNDWAHKELSPSGVKELEDVIQKDYEKSVERNANLKPTEE